MKLSLRKAETDQLEGVGSARNRFKTVMEQTLASLKCSQRRNPYDIRIERCRILIQFFFLFNIVASVTSLPTCADKRCVQKTSRSILQDENSLSIGGGVKLSKEEKFVNSKILVPIKEEELANYDHLSDKGKVFQFIRKMPKGGDLHIHDISMVNIHWVVSELTYLPGLYYCDIRGKYVRFRFSDHLPEREDFCDDTWMSVKEKREEIGPEKFDKMLYDKMTVDGKQQGALVAWDDFIDSILCVADLMYSETGFRSYFKQALRELYEDNVLYVEVRTIMDPMLRNNGKHFSREETLRMFIKVAEEFTEENPGFIGAKFIFLTVRSMPKETIESDIRLAMELHKKYPQHLIGYDLVGYENNGPPLSDLLDILFIPAQSGVNLPFFFHAGETNRFGDTDINILSAILLNTTRIGHAFALTKHPDLMKMVKEKDIAIEVNPISNQVLNFVSDMRNHPGAVFFANGLPVVICSDDPAPWRTSGLSYDYHAAFMAFTKAKDGLEVLKEMSRAGIKYSAMSKDEKSRAFDIWRHKWDDFINSFSSSGNKDQRLQHEDL